MFNSDNFNRQNVCFVFLTVVKKQPFIVVFDGRRSTFFFFESLPNYKWLHLTLSLFLLLSSLQHVLQEDIANGLSICPSVIISSKTILARSFKFGTFIKSVLQMWLQVIRISVSPNFYFIYLLIFFFGGGF